MANNYSQWSEYFPLNSKEESDWLKSVLRIDISEYTGEEYDNLYEAQIMKKVLSEKFGIEISEDSADCFPNFSEDFYDSGVCVYAEEYGDIDNAVAIFQTFLKKFRPDDYFKIEWAETCSKPRSGEFGGGAVFVTADNVEWITTGTWVSERAKKFEK